MSHYRLRHSGDDRGSNDSLSTLYPPVIRGAHYSEPCDYGNEIEEQTDMFLSELEQELGMSPGKPSSESASIPFSVRLRTKRHVLRSPQTIKVETEEVHSPYGNRLFTPHDICTPRYPSYSFIKEEEKDSTDLHACGTYSHSAIENEGADPLDLHVDGATSHSAIERGENHREPFSVKQQSRSGEPVRITAQNDVERLRTFSHSTPEIRALFGRNSSLEPRISREELPISRKETFITPYSHDTTASRFHSSNRLSRLRGELERIRSELEDAEMRQARADAELRVALGHLEVASILIQYLSSVARNNEDDDSVSQSYSQVARATGSNGASSSFQDVGSNGSLTLDPYVSTSNSYSSNPNSYASTSNPYTSNWYTSTPNPYTCPNPYMPAS